MRQLPADEAASIEIDGQVPTRDQLAALALDGYGHFTAMQIRNGRVRALALHQARLRTGNQELFGQDADAGAIREYVRHALDTSQAQDASVRVYVRRLSGRPAVLVTVRPPGGMPQQPWRLASVPYTRTLPHVKHLGGFGQGYYRQHVQAKGFDEALLTSPSGSIAEGSITNVGFFDGAGIVWPDAPMLAGITMAVLDSRLAKAGLSSRRQRITTPDLGGFAAAFVTNARGIAPVGALDDHEFAVDDGLMSRLTAAYESAPWDQI